MIALALVLFPCLLSCTSLTFGKHELNHQLLGLAFRISIAMSGTQAYLS